MKEKTINFNNNQSECIKDYQKIGVTVYQNICNGERTEVPWGIGGWLILVLLTSIFIGIAIGIIKYYKDEKEWEKYQAEHLKDMFRL